MSGGQLALLHTAALHEARFSALHARHCADLPLRQYSDDALLARAREGGLDDPQLRDAVRTRLSLILEEGASALLCTCSTLGAVVESLGWEIKLPTLRVDRPMARAAVEHGPRIALLASLESTLAPSSALIHEAAARAGQSVEVESHLLPEVFSATMAGEHDVAMAGIHAAIDRLQQSVAPPQVIVLAQVSMADAAQRPTSVPVLSSPRRGLLAAAALCR